MCQNECKLTEVLMRENEDLKKQIKELQSELVVLKSMFEHKG